MPDPYAYFYADDGGDREYDDNSFSDWLDPFFTEGVFNGQLQVLANDNMTVTVQPGYAHVAGKTRNFFTETVLDVSIAHSTYPRKDIVVVRRDDANRNFFIQIKTGTAAQTPVAPEIVRENEIYELKLCEIDIPAGATQITQAQVTDTRMDSTVCGWVAATVTEITFDQIKMQFDSWLAQYQTALVGKQDKILADTEAWLKELEDVLDKNVAANLLLQIRKLRNNIAAVDGTTASKAYSAGDYVISDEILFKAISTIAQGAAIQSGVNAQQVTVMDEVKGFHAEGILRDTGNIFQIIATDWTLNSETNLYEYTLQATTIYSPTPDICLSGATVGAQATTDEEKAFGCLTATGHYAETSDNTVHLYASKAPTVDFYLMIKGVA